jgi:hypothetical protein
LSEVVEESGRSEDTSSGEALWRRALRAVHLAVTAGDTAQSPLGRALEGRGREMLELARRLNDGRRVAASKTRGKGSLVGTARSKGRRTHTPPITHGNRVAKPTSVPRTARLRNTTATTTTTRVVTPAKDVFERASRGGKSGDLSRAPSGAAQGASVEQEQETTNEAVETKSKTSVSRKPSTNARPARSGGARGRPKALPPRAAAPVSKKGDAAGSSASSGRAGRPLKKGLSVPEEADAAGSSGRAGRASKKTTSVPETDGALEHGLRRSTRIRKGV